MVPHLISAMSSISSCIFVHKTPFPGKGQTVHEPGHLSSRMTAGRQGRYKTVHRGFSLAIDDIAVLLIFLSR